MPGSHVMMTMPVNYETVTDASYTVEHVRASKA